jgi:hypothetical protein
LAGKASSQDHADAAAQANNPLANMTAFNLQNYYIGELTESDDSANQFWLRFAKPFSVAKTNWIMRASLPVNTFPTQPDGDKETGIGNRPGLNSEDKKQISDQMTVQWVNRLDPKDDKLWVEEPHWLKHLEPA